MEVEIWRGFFNRFPFNGAARDMNGEMWNALNGLQNIYAAYQNLLDYPKLIKLMSDKLNRQDSPATAIQ